MLSSSSVVPPGNCGIHGYHGRAACPNCSTSALPFQSPPPGPASASPADTPAIVTAFNRHYTQVCRCEWREDEFTRETTSENCVIHGKVPDPLDALLAVGERDRQQIARLTEVGKAAQIVAELNGEKRSTYGRPVTNVEWQNALYHLETAVSGARAVLADEEDAANG